MTCVLSSHLHALGKSPIAHLTVSTSIAVNRRRRWRMPANLTMSSRCSCRSPEGPAAHMGARRTCGREAAPFRCLPTSFISAIACLKTPSPQATPRAWSCFSCDERATCRLELRGIRALAQASLVEASAAVTPPTRPCMALPDRSMAVNSRARFPFASSESNSTSAIDCRCAFEVGACCPWTRWDSSSNRSSSQRRKRRFTSSLRSASFGIGASRSLVRCLAKSPKNHSQPSSPQDILPKRQHTWNTLRLASGRGYGAQAPQRANDCESSRSLA